MGKMTLEELLNKLIEKGWRPNGEHNGPHKPFIRLYKDRTHGIQFYYNEWRDGDYKLEKVFSLRDIVSKESNLWQFVCDKGLVKKDEDINKDMEKYMYKCEYVNGCGQTINYWKRSKFTHHYFYEYFIIKSALCDEDKLEQFLLDNIKIEG